MLRALLVASLLVSLPAWAEPEVRVLGGVSGLVATSAKTDAAPVGLAGAELDLSLRADVRNVGGRADFRIDYLGREGFVDLGLWLRDGFRGNERAHLLRELSVRVRLAPRVRLTLGRVTTPGDFWLIVDGAKLEVDYTPWLSQSIYGGLRAFTTGFRETHLTDEPAVLGLAGTALSLRTKFVDAEVLFTWAQDRLDFSNQLRDDRLVLEHHVESDWFLQGSAAVHPAPGVALIAGARLGTRYDMQWNATTPFGATQIGTANLSAVSAWAIAEWAPNRLDGRMRLQYQFNFERIYLFQSQLIGMPTGGGPTSAADGDFQDHVARVLGRLAKDMQGDLSYRLRFRQNGDREHHLILGLRDRHLIGNFGYLGAVDMTIINPAHIFFAPQVKTFVRGVYSVALTYMDQRFDARLGIHYTEGIGSGLLSSPLSPPTVGNLKTLLFPYVLESNQVAAASFFYSGHVVFCGIDIEESLVSFQLRAMAQLGVAL